MSALDKAASLARKAARSETAHFLERVREAAPMTVSKTMTDKGSQFADSLTRKTNEPGGKRHFDVRCQAQGTELLSTIRYPIR